MDQDGVDFCAKTFDAIPVYSNVQVEKIPIKEKFDLIWVGSLFTHLGLDDWKKFLRFFESHLKLGGILVFTVAGSFVSKFIQCGRLEGIDKIGASSLLYGSRSNGFGFANYKYVKGREWGRTLVKPSWVSSLLEELPSLRLLTYTERGWGARQDVVSCIKEDIIVPEH